MRWLFATCFLLLAGCEPIIIDCGDEKPQLVLDQTSPYAPPVKPVVAPDGNCCPDGNCPNKNVPPVDLPSALRTSNYGGGSCLHAAFQDVLRWQNQERAATYWRANYAGAAGIGTITAVCDKLNLDYAYTTQGDVGFLDWASRTRRGAAIYWQGGAHAITFCGFVGNSAVVIDNNHPAQPRTILRQEFLEHWQSSNGCAVTPVYAPTPPRPWI